MNTYRNRNHRNPWHGVKPARAVTPDKAEASRMAANIRRLCSARTFETFVTMRQAGSSIEALRAFHHLVTAPVVEAEEALTADWREDQADRLDYARGQF